MTKVMVLKPCWINGSRAEPGSYLELSETEATELGWMGKVSPALESPPAEETAVKPRRETRPKRKSARRGPKT